MWSAKISTMANQSGAIARFLIKWLVIPVGLAAVGFFVVGPRLGAQGRQEAGPADGGQGSMKTEQSEAAKKTGNPDVTISSKPVTRRRTRRTRPRTEAREQPGENAKAPEVPSREEEPPNREG